MILEWYFEFSIVLEFRDKAECIRVRRNGSYKFRLYQSKEINRQHHCCV